MQHSTASGAVFLCHTFITQPQRSVARVVRSLTGMNTMEPPICSEDRQSHTFPRSCVSCCYARVASERTSLESASVATMTASNEEQKSEQTFSKLSPPVPASHKGTRTAQSPELLRAVGGQTRLHEPALRQGARPVHVSQLEKKRNLTWPQ